MSAVCSPTDTPRGCWPPAANFMEQKSHINPAILQPMLESAANATEKGQAQFFTPLNLARTLAGALPRCRPAIVDLNCGAGHLLQAAALPDTELLLGNDIDSARPKIDGLENPRPVSRLTSDLTRLYPLLTEINFTADLFVLNPPWRLWWYRDRLHDLAQSGLPAVRDAFAAMEPGAPRKNTVAGTIDSTIATLLIALDRCSYLGEGLLLANNATLERLIFAPNAPHAAIAKHIWAHLVIPGNPLSGSATGNWADGDGDFKTGVLFFAANHETGPKKYVWRNIHDSRLPDRVFRLGAELSHRDWAQKTIKDGWLAVKERLAELAGQTPPFHLWLDSSGRIQCHLSRFESQSVKLNKQEAERLFRLQGKVPMKLVLQRVQREDLLQVAQRGGWRVAPELAAAVSRAVADYHCARAPLYPLPKIQRLGYLDEQDDILCCQSLGEHFLAGRRYFLRSTTVATKRSGSKVNNLGLLDDVEWNGQELAFFITDESDVERCFMEGRLREENVKLNLIRPGAKGRKERDLQAECAIDFTLQELAEHFVIPEVPDVATQLPQQYAAHRQTMRAIAKLATGFEFKKFQLDDYARAALHDGVILGHDTGLGKTIAMFIWPLLKCGVLAEGHHLQPAKPVLLVVPGDGHDQTEDEAWKHFKIRAGMIRLDSQATFRKLARPDPRTGRFTLEPRYYLTSYTQLTGNGVVEFPSLDRANPERTLSQLSLKESDAMEWWHQRGQIYSIHYERLKVTPGSTRLEMESAFKLIRRTSDKLVTDLAWESLLVLEQLTPVTSALQWDNFSAEQKQFVRSELVITRHKEFSGGIGETRNGIKCIYSPSLADLCRDCFAACVIDEGTKIKGDDTLIGTGVRSINTPFRLVLTATPIKNRFPDLFHLAHYVAGGHDEPTARFPYGKVDKQDFAEEFLVSERNLTKESLQTATGSNRRFIKFTPQVCNVHRAWKLLAPIILRRRKEDCGEDIVPKLRHVVRVPMGLGQAAAYQFHLKARYLDVNSRPAVGAKLQALRIAAANPASELLVRPEHDVTPGNPRSLDTYIPKVATTLELIRQVMERGEQVLVFSAFQNGLDVFSARLREAGVPHLVLDGRLSQKRRGELAKLFKQGPPRAVAEGLIGRCGSHPVALCGAECMAEMHSFHLCNNVILTAYSWAFDKFEQGINRAHRLNSPWPVNVWSVVCDGSIDRKLEAGIHEKKDAAELVLDGHLLGETPAEVNLHELLLIARTEFKSVKTIDEDELKRDWPRLRAALGKACFDWQKMHMREVIQANRKLHTKTIELPLWRFCFNRLF